MRHNLLLFAMTAILVTTPAYAFNPAGADILGLRLGMLESDVTEILARQGFHLTRAPDSCISDRCHVTIRATTKDGELLIALSAKTGVEQVQYMFLGHGVGEAEKIRASIIERFGPPDQQKPMVWCRTPSGGGSCPEHDASLSFSTDKIMLMLRAGDQRS